MDNLAVILGVDEKTIRDELGEIKSVRWFFKGKRIIWWWLWQIQKIL